MWFAFLRMKVVSNRTVVESTWRFKNLYFKYIEAYMRRLSFISRCSESIDRKNEELYSLRIKHFEQELEVVNWSIRKLCFRFVEKNHSSLDRSIGTSLFRVYIVDKTSHYLSLVLDFV